MSVVGNVNANVNATLLVEKSDLLSEHREQYTCKLRASQVLGLIIILDSVAKDATVTRRIAL